LQSFAKHEITVDAMENFQSLLELNARPFSIYSLCVDMLHSIFYIRLILLISLYISTVLRFNFHLVQLFPLCFPLWGEGEASNATERISYYISLCREHYTTLEINRTAGLPCNSAHLSFASTIK